MLFNVHRNNHRLIMLLLKRRVVFPVSKVCIEDACRGVTMWNEDSVRKGCTIYIFQ
jgi:hypothetical protein